MNILENKTTTGKDISRSQRPLNVGEKVMLCSSSRAPLPLRRAVLEGGPHCLVPGLPSH